MKSQIKKSFIHILIASVICTGLYIALYAIWGAVLSNIENETVNLAVLGTLTSAMYALILVFIVKKRHDVGTDEVMRDYKDSTYISPLNDLKTVLQNEKIYLAVLGAIVCICFVLNKFDALVFGKKIISVVAFPFTVIHIYAACFNAYIDFIGYFLSYAVIVAFYLLFLLLYRRKQYNIWLKKERS